MKKFLMVFLTVCMVVSCMIVPSMAADNVWLSTVKNYAVRNLSEQYPNYAVLYSESTDETMVLFWDDSKGQFNDLISGIWNFGANNDYTVNYEKQFVTCGDDGEVVVLQSTTCEQGNGFSSESFFVYSANDSFFQQPLPSLTETVEELTMEQSMVVQNQTVGVMKILVPCGVGCLALLMALPLLSRKFKIFLR